MKTFHLITNAANLVDIVELGSFPTQHLAYLSMIALSEILQPLIGDSECHQSLRMIDSDGNEIVEYTIGD